MPGGWTSIGWNVGAAGFQASEAGWNPSILSLSVLLWSLDNQDPCTRTTNGTVRLIDRSRSGTARQMQPGRCYKFNGTADYVASAAAVIGGGSALTVWARVYHTSGTYLVSEWSTSSKRSWALYFLSGTARASLSGNGVAQENFVGPIVSTGTWHTLALTYDGANVTFFLDGTASSPQATGVSSLFATTEPLSLGAVNTSTAATGFFNGYLQDVRVFNRVLTSNELAELDAMSAGSTDIGPVDAEVFYKCDEGGTYATAIDSSGSGNDGTITASAIATFQDESANDQYSFQNELGYTDDTGSSGALLPRDESATTLDTGGGALEFTGQAPHDPILSSPCVTLDGTADVVSYGSTGVSTTEVKLWVKQLVDNQELLTLQNSTATAVTVVAGTLTYGGSLTVTATDIDGTDYTSDLAGAGALLNDNNWHELTITLSAITASDLRIGTDGSGFGNISYAHLRLNTTDLISWGCEGAGTVVHDSSGNDKHGAGTFASEAATWANTIDKTDTLVTDGFVGATRFSGTGEYYRHSARLTSGDRTKLSLGVWLYITASGTKYIAGEFESTGDQRAWLVYRDAGGAIKVIINNTGAAAGNNVETTDSSLPTGRWVHLAVVFASSTVTIYFDGSSVSSTTAGTIPSSFFNSTAPFEFGAADFGIGPWEGLMCGLVAEEAEWTASQISAMYSSGTIPSSAWYWPFADENETQQGLADLTENGTPDWTNVPSGSGPTENAGPCILAPGCSLDLGGGEANSPYAQQLADLLADLTYDQADDDEADALFARVNNEGDDRIIVTIPALTGDDLANMQEYTT